MNSVHGIYIKDQFLIFLRYEHNLKLNKVQLGINV